MYIFVFLRVNVYNGGFGIALVGCNNNNNNIQNALFESMYFTARLCTNDAKSCIRSFSLLFGFR